MPTVPLTRGREIQQAGLPNARVSVDAPTSAFGGGPGVEQVAQGVSQLTKAASQIAQAEQEKANQMRMLEERRAMNEWETTNIYDPKTGASSRRGKNAFGIPDDLKSSFDAFIADREKGLSNDEQRLAFRQLSGSRWESVSKWAQTHVAQESERAEKLEYDASLESSKERGSTDPRNAPLEVGFLRQQVMQRAKKEGWGKEQIHQAVQKEESDLHGRAVKKMLAEGQDSTARHYFDGVKPRLDPDKATEIENWLRVREKTRADQSDALALMKLRDPWKYLKKIGETQAQPLDVTADATKSFEARGLYIDEMKKKHGVNLPFASPLEVETFIDGFQRLNPKQATGLLANLDTLVGEPYKRAFGKDVFQKDPAFAAALMVSSDSPEDARKIITGIRFIRSGKDGTGRALTMPSQAQVDESFDAALGPAVASPDVRLAVKQAALAHLISERFDAGQSDVKDVMPKEIRKSIEAVIGPIVEINGTKTTTFRRADGRFVDEDDLEDIVDSLTDEKVEKVLGDVPRTLDGKPLNLKKARGNFSLEAIGSGVYWLKTPQGYALNKDKQPFRLDLRPIEKEFAKEEAVRQARRDAFRPKLGSPEFPF